MNEITIKYLKWTSTFLTLFGILAFYLDYYPYSMIPHGLGIIEMDSCRHGNKG
jgi:hypothetical protein